jgi:signal transduction histidine kinase
MRLSIRYQLLLPLLTLLLGVVGISTWTAIASANRAREQLEARVRNVAQTLSESNIPLAAPHVLEMIAGLSGAEYVLVGKDGRLRPSSTIRAEPSLLRPAGVAERWQEVGLGPPVAIDNEKYLCSGVRLHRADFEGTLYILYPERLWRDALWQAILPSLVLGLFGGLASLALALGVAHRFSRRVLELERRTRLIASGDFSPVPLPKRNDELRDLTRSVNDMAQQLAQLQETVRKTERLRLLGQVSGGLAHQLRNGVAGARLAVQVHARECDGHGDAEALDVALRQLTLVEANLKRFLDLGRAESLRREPCSLIDLINEAVTLLRPRCRHAHIDLRWQAPDTPASLSGDPGQLGHLFLNVIGNAIDAAGPGGWVEVRLTHSEGRMKRTEERTDDEPGHDATGAAWVIDVIDSGPGPPAELAGRLFEPFVTGKPDGVGLGLAVARQVVEAHGGRIGWHREGDRTCFRIELARERGP